MESKQSIYIEDYARKYPELLPILNEKKINYAIMRQVYCMLVKIFYDERYLDLLLFKKNNNSFDMQNYNIMLFGYEDLKLLCDNDIIIFKEFYNCANTLNLKQKDKIIEYATILSADNSIHNTNKQYVLHTYDDSATVSYLLAGGPVLSKVTYKYQYANDRLMLVELHDSRPYELIDITAQYDAFNDNIFYKAFKQLLGSDRDDADIAKLFVGIFGEYRDIQTNQELVRDILYRSYRVVDKSKINKVKETLQYDTYVLKLFFYNILVGLGFEGNLEDNNRRNLQHVANNNTHDNLYHIIQPLAVEVGTIEFERQLVQFGGSRSNVEKLISDAEFQMKQLMDINPNALSAYDKHNFKIMIKKLKTIDEYLNDDLNNSKVKNVLNEISDSTKKQVHDNLLNIAAFMMMST